MVRLGDVCEKITDYVASGSFAALKENVLITNEENYAIMVKTADFSNGFTKGLTYTDRRGYDFLKNSNLFGGELILSNIGSIGKVFKVPYLNRPMTLASNTVMIKTSTVELTDYLYYYFLSPAGYKSLLSISSGTSMLKFNKTELKKLEVPVPDLDKQRCIIAVMDKISKLISLRKQQLAKLDELVKARFVELFGDPVENPYGWEQTTLKNIAIGKLSYGSGASAYEYDGNIRYVRITDIDNSGRLNNDVVSPSVIDEKYILNDGDILFARSGATVGKSYRYRESDGKCLYAGYLIRLVPNTELVLPDYVFYYTKTSYYERFIASNMKVVAQPNINAQQYGDLTICIPPMELQKEFLSFVEQTDKSKLAIQQSLDKLETLKKSLMQKYFG